LKAANFLRILAVTAALSAYAAWTDSHRQRTASVTGSERSIADIPLLRTAEAEKLWGDNTTLFLDVRSVYDYESGHISGALNLPEEEFEVIFPTLRERLERAGTLVVYCKSEDCGKSLWSAIRLRQQGLRQTTIYPEGWNDWVTRGLPINRSTR
jgi:rhodanese-related sulfurtransferase